MNVRVRFAADGFVMSIKDDGCGFDTTSVFGSDHLGLQSMKARVAKLGGRIRFHSKPGTGTKVSVRIYRP